MLQVSLYRDDGSVVVENAPVNYWVRDGRRRGQVSVQGSVQLRTRVLTLIEPSGPLKKVILVQSAISGGVTRITFDEINE